ncbi:Cofactor assembly of complex C subunit B CCB2/CCB4 protein [Dioscorea alata]|uniref:Cofactor assembly of complex C subunit B CCB2/CCB4 protein n=1 Tax=Dioscorea alata TaxID=55571 RepID=A0ACB7WK08_DIOAL|nr:Cofactor assembly of complex C subunit B CCB2/CCB4 protein [Dioscorea alata]
MVVNSTKEYFSGEPHMLQVVLRGVECRRLNPLISERAVLEMLWAWDSLSAVTCCRSLVVVYDSSCVLQIGVAAESLLEAGDAMDVDVKKLLQGSLCRSAMESQKLGYLAANWGQWSCKNWWQYYKGVQQY